MIKMYHFKHSDGSITFLGIDPSRREYSRDYYANVGICNAEESVPISYKRIRGMIAAAESLNYKKVMYLRRGK